MISIRGGRVKRHSFSEDDMFQALDGLLTEEEGVCIDNERLSLSSGKFAWIYDPEGNIIELWEPVACRQ